MLLPVILALFAALLLPWQGLLCVLTLEVLLAVIPLTDGPPPKFMQRLFHQATQAAIEWMSIKVVYAKEEFASPGPYVLGMCSAVDLVIWLHSSVSECHTGVVKGFESLCTPCAWNCEYKASYAILGFGHCNLHTACIQTHQLMHHETSAAVSVSGVQLGTLRWKYSRFLGLFLDVR